MPDGNITIQPIQRRLSLPVGHHFLMFLLFLGLKLGGAIEWHWFWVCLPMILKLSLIGAMFVRRILIETRGDDEEDDE